MYLLLPLIDAWNEIPGATRGEVSCLCTTSKDVSIDNANTVLL